MINLGDQFKSFSLNIGLEGNQKEIEMYSLGREILSLMRKSNGRMINGERIKYDLMREEFKKYVSSEYNQYYSCFQRLREKIESEENKFGLYRKD